MNKETIRTCYNDFIAGAIRKIYNHLEFSYNSPDCFDPEYALKDILTHLKLCLKTNGANQYTEYNVNRIKELETFIKEVDENWHNYSDLRFSEKAKELLSKQ